MAGGEEGGGGGGKNNLTELPPPETDPVPLKHELFNVLDRALRKHVYSNI